MSGGRKDDTGKARFDLIPPRPLYEEAELFGMGATKYEDRNWEKGLAWGRVFAAMMRHAWKWWAGEEYDPEDGQHHLTSCAWCAHVLREFTYTHPELDDRPHQYRPEPRRGLLGKLKEICDGIQMGVSARLAAVQGLIRRRSKARVGTESFAFCYRESRPRHPARHL